MTRALGIVTTAICWLFGALFALGSVYGFFDDDTEITVVIVCAILAIAFLSGGLAAGRKIRYVGEDLDDRDKAYLQGLESGRRKR